MTRMMSMKTPWVIAGSLLSVTGFLAIVVYLGFLQ